MVGISRNMIGVLSRVKIGGGLIELGRFVICKWYKEI